MSNPLSRNKNRQFDMKGKNDLLERRGVFVPQQIVDQTFIFSDCFCTVSVRNPCCLYDWGVASNIINQTYKSFIKNGKRPVQNRFCFGNNTMRHKILQLYCFIIIYSGMFVTSFLKNKSGRRTFRHRIHFPMTVLSGCLFSRESDFRVPVVIFCLVCCRKIIFVNIRNPFAAVAVCINGFRRVLIVFVVIKNFVSIILIGRVRG